MSGAVNRPGHSTMAVAVGWQTGSSIGSRVVCLLVGRIFARSMTYLSISHKLINF